MNLRCSHVCHDAGQVSSEPTFNLQSATTLSMRLQQDHHQQLIKHFLSAWHGIAAHFGSVDLLTIQCGELVCYNQVTIKRHAIMLCKLCKQYIVSSSSFTLCTASQFIALTLWHCSCSRSLSTSIVKGSSCKSSQLSQTLCKRIPGATVLLCLDGGPRLVSQQFCCIMQKEASRE